jgi:S-adenosylmethionine decarboxylase proenzyme
MENTKLRSRKSKIKNKSQDKQIKGGHYILDFFGCDPEQLNSIKFWQENLTESANAAGMEILHNHFHEFTPQGITGFLLLSTSHISMHTWPEFGYVACDVFSCSDDNETRKAVDYLKKSINHKTCEVEFVERGYIV